MLNICPHDEAPHLKCLDLSITEREREREREREATKIAGMEIGMGLKNALVAGQTF